MAFEHACFVSYRHHEQSQLAERFINDLCAALRNELAVLIEEDLFIDRERMRGGAFFNPILARALCKSVCMIAVYTPTYFSKSNTYCAREYRAMEMLEEHRLERATHALRRESGLIIPIVLRGEASLPAGIKSKRHYYSFEKFSLTTGELSRSRQFETIVREIASAIYSRKQMLDAVADDITSNCDGFEIPTDDELHPWIEAMTVSKPAFPFRVVS